ncbi:HNH endonuclease [Frigoribacterium sp. UYMn621]|uniref:HNH endonuclease n=1 Tax=Frigoribacterium sp. UYMn621 TaxID=3156343 RepID=UPI00339435F3
MMGAEWFPLVGFESHYSITGTGRIRRNGAIVDMKTHLAKGYPTLRVSVNGKTTLVQVHRALGLAFIPNPADLPVVRHKNDDPSDFRLENLEWGTQTDNNLDAIRNGLNVMSNKTHCKNMHEFTFENTQIERTRSGIHRKCRICSREANLRYLERKRQKTEVSA